MKLTEKIAYLQGLMEGMDLDKSSKEGKIFSGIADILSEVGCYIDDLQDQIDELTELCDNLDEDLGDVEELLYDDIDEEDYAEDYEEDDDFGDDDEEFDFDDDETLYEVVCPSCGDSIVLNEALLEDGEVECPNCGENLEFDYDEIGEFEEDSDEDEE